MAETEQKPLTFQEILAMLGVFTNRDISASTIVECIIRDSEINIKTSDGKNIFTVFKTGPDAGNILIGDYDGGKGLFWNWTTGLLTLKNVTLSDNVKITDLVAGSEPAIQQWMSNLTFSATDYRVVAWTSGTITLMDGTTFSISAGNTGNMSALTYIYLDKNVSTTVLQVTTTPATAVGTGKVLLAVAQNVADVTKYAKFQVFSGSGGVGGSFIAADNIIVTTLAAIVANMGAITAGNITLDTSGFIKGGQSAFDTGDNGFWFGYVSSAWKFSMASTAGQRLTMDNSGLTIKARVDSIVGDNLLDSADTNRTFTYSSYTKIKDIKVFRGGAYRIKFTLSGGAGGTTYGRIYGNGVAVGTEQSVGNTTTEFSEDISGWTAGDNIQLYVKITGITSRATQNFRIYNLNNDNTTVVLD